MISMPTHKIRNFYIFRKDLHAPCVSAFLSSDPLLIFFLFVPTKKKLSLTEFERLGIWAAMRAREEVKKNMMKKTDS
jgi:hypothetical protein